jgi:hypothetical protein
LSSVSCQDFVAMGRKVTVAVSTLNLWALDFDGNRDKILASVSI